MGIKAASSNGENSPLPLPTGFTSPLSAAQGNVRNSLQVPSLRHTLALVSSPVYLSLCHLWRRNNGYCLPGQKQWSMMLPSSNVYSKKVFFFRLHLPIFIVPIWIKSEAQKDRVKGFTQEQ